MMGIPANLQALTKERIDRSSITASVAFLTGIWTYPPKAYTVMGIKSGDRWKDIFITGNREAQIEQVLRDYPPGANDVYFCLNAFDRPSRKAAYALPSAYAWVDIDDNDLARYDPQPNAVWRTSPGRHQGLWVWEDASPAAIAEQFSRNIVYKDGGDKNGWSITKMLRLPGTINHKPAYAKPVVILTTYDPRPQKLPQALSAVHAPLAIRPTRKGSIDVGGVDRRDVLQRYRDRVDLQARTLMEASRVIYPDRSKAIFIMVSDLVKAGASDAEIVTVLLGDSHFLSKHGTNVAMAEREVVAIRAKVEAGQ